MQAGLNLHHVADGIIFFSLPWEIDSIDQLIGRVDRLGATGERKGGRRVIDIWRILIEGSQETAIADTVAELGVFDSPLPPLSPTDLAELQTTLGHAALRRKAALLVTPLAGKGIGLPTLFRDAEPFTQQQAAADFELWRVKPCPAPAMMSDLARPNETPIRREERTLGAWLKTIKASRDFDTGGRLDKEDGYGFQTIWYHGVGERGRAGEAPFSLPGASRESWMSGHVPFIYRRAHISAPPRKIVFTDDGELGADGTRSGRPLRFLDHGSELHDALVSGYTASLLSAFGTAKPVVQTSVRLPEGHPARGLGPLVVVTVAQFDPFPDELLPPAWTTEARQLLNSAPTDVQKSALSADRRMLHTLLRAFQRRLRVAAPAVFMRKGYWKAKDGWRELTEGEVDLCLQPITASTNNALARGRTPLSALEKHEVVNALRSRHLAKINAEVEEYRGSVLDRIRHELEGLTDQVSAYFLAEIRNRELNLERRRQAPPEAGPVELWQGQVAALERSLSMARLNFSEATDFLQGLAAGHHPAPTVQPCTILLALIAEE